MDLGGAVDVVLCRVLVTEEGEGRVLEKADNGKTENLAQEHTGYALLEHLDAWVHGLLVELNIVGGVRQSAQRVVERTPFGVDNHLAGGSVVLAGVFALGELGDLIELLDVGAVGAGAEDGTEQCASLAGRGVGASHEGSHGIVDQSGHPHGQAQGVDLGLEQGAHILADGVGDVEALGPAHEQPLVDAYLVHREGEGEAQVENLLLLDGVSGVPAPDVSLVVFFMVGLEEFLDLLGEEGEELLGRLRDHEVLGNGNLALGQGEGGVAVQLDGANAEVCAAQIDGHVEALRCVSGAIAGVASEQVQAQVLLWEVRVGIAVAPSRFRWARQ